MKRSRCPQFFTRLKISFRNYYSFGKDDIETINAIKGFNCKIIYQKVNGYGAALIEGINSVETEYFCIFNADGSFNPMN